MESNPFLEYKWVQESIGLTRLETFRLENLELEMFEKSPYGYPLGDIQPSLSFQIGEKNYTIFPGTFSDLLCVTQYICENHPLRDFEEIAIIINQEKKDLMN